MKPGKNISIAFKIVYQTYENLFKLFSYLKSETAKSNEYVLITALNKFLRTKPEQVFDGWLIQNFILLFQKCGDLILDNGWRNGAIYALEINFDDYEVPRAYISRFTYNDIGSWGKGCSPTFDHCVFYDPINNPEGIVDYIIDDGIKYSGVAVGDGDECWGLKTVQGYTMDLTDITAENAGEKILGSFNLLEHEAMPSK